MSTLAKAISIAAEAHVNQLRWTGEPYFCHPYRIMMQMDTPVEQIVAILHDVIEDSDLSFDFLEDKGFSKDVIDALKLLTHDTDVLYRDYISLIASSKLATKVKCADLTDNMDISMLPYMDDKSWERLKKYRDQSCLREQSEL